MYFGASNDFQRTALFANPSSFILMVDNACINALSLAVEIILWICWLLIQGSWVSYEPSEVILVVERTSCGFQGFGGATPDGQALNIKDDTHLCVIIISL